MSLALLVVLTATGIHLPAVQCPPLVDVGDQLLLSIAAVQLRESVMVTSLLSDEQRTASLCSAEALTSLR